MSSQPLNQQPAFESSDELRIAQAGLLAALLQQVGYAIWQAAECEDTLAHYLVVRVHASRGIGEAAGESLLASARKRTFGSLLKELREEGVLEPTLEARLSAFLDERNWLVHRARRENRGVLNNPAAFDMLALRLANLAQEALDLHKMLGARLEEFVLAAGVDRTVIDREAARLIEQWGYWE